MVNKEVSKEKNDKRKMTVETLKDDSSCVKEDGSVDKRAYCKTVWQSKFNHWSSCKGGRREPTPRISLWPIHVHHGICTPSYRSIMTWRQSWDSIKTIPQKTGTGTEWTIYLKCKWGGKQLKAAETGQGTTHPHNLKDGHSREKGMWNKT